MKFCYDNVKFNSNPSTGVTSASIEGTQNFFQDYIRTNFPEFAAFLPRFKSGLMMDSYSASTRLSKEDEWDENKGKMVAYTKLKANFYNAFFNRCSAFNRFIDSQVAAMNFEEGKFCGKIQDNLNYIYNP